MRKSIIIVLATATLTARGQWTVIDPAVLAQTVQEVENTTQQLTDLETEIKRLGDPASFLPTEATALIHSIELPGVGKTWDQLRTLADGSTAMTYTGDGLYHAVGQTIVTAAGTQFARLPADYKKFDAIAKATSTLEDVLNDTQTRRQAVLNEIATTTEQLRVATTTSEIQKLLGVLNAQGSELSAIDRERQAAMNRVEAQKVENETDKAKQEQAHQEERIVDFQTAQQVMAGFLTPDTAPVQLPDPRVTQP